MADFKKISTAFLAPISWLAALAPSPKLGRLQGIFNRISRASIVSSGTRTISKAWSTSKKYKYTFSPAELSSERGEKEVLADIKQPTAPPSTKSQVSYCAARACRREKNGGRRYMKHDGTIASPVGSCLCCWQLPLSVAAVTPGHPNQISVSYVCRGAEARIAFLTPISWLAVLATSPKLGRL